MDYIKRTAHLERGIALFPNKSALCRAMGIQLPRLNAWLWGDNGMPADMAIRFEKVTNGEVTCEQLRPDVEWSYIRGNSVNAE